MPISTAVDVSAVARVVGIKTTFKNLRAGGILFLPQRVAVIGQGATASTYSTVKAQVTSALEVAQNYGFGSPLHLAVQQLLPANGDGVGSIPVTVYPLVDDGAGAAAAGDITPVGNATGPGTFDVMINNVFSGRFSVATGDAPAVTSAALLAAVQAELNAPMTAAAGVAPAVDLTAKWKGASGNDLHIEVVGPTDIGITWTITQPAAGAANPSVQPALDQIGNVWETMVLNCMEIGDSTNLDRYQTFGDGRWGALVRKPLVVFTGETSAAVATAIAVSDARKTDKVNSQLVAPGSNDLPVTVAARQLARIVAVANNNPPRDYGRQQATGLTPGTDAQQWTYTQRDQAVKGGSSTSEAIDGVVSIGDVVTFYHPSGDPTPAYRYVADIVKLQNVIFNIDLIFNTADWDGAPLIPDNQPTVNGSAKKPKTAVTAIAAMLDNLGLNAIISDPETAKAGTVAEIDSANPKRLNVHTTVQLSGNANIISIDLDFGFYFGTPAVIA